MAPPRSPVSTIRSIGKLADCLTWTDTRLAWPAPPFPRYPRGSCPRASKPLQQAGRARNSHFTDAGAGSRGWSDLAKVTESSRRGGAASHPPPARPSRAECPRRGGPSPPPDLDDRATQTARTRALAPGPRMPREPGDPSRDPPARSDPDHDPSGPPSRPGPTLPHPQSSGRALGPGQIAVRVRVTASTPWRPGHGAKHGSGFQLGREGR
ncbi:unnamed protein product [Rangifer tarandus platyrhynchus]|uniref:Uncharacterized protein n=1 Tax=Rangifer tarandus platyrhynchus TaxID=3082113 RepID=A0AC59ZSR1_RANTA